MDKWHFEKGVLWYLLGVQKFYSLERAVGTIRTLGLEKVKVITGFNPAFGLWYWFIVKDTEEAKETFEGYEDIREVPQEEIDREHEEFDKQFNKYFK